MLNMKCCCFDAKTTVRGLHSICFAAFWFGTFLKLSVPLGVLFVMKTLEDEWYVVTKLICMLS